MHTFKRVSVPQSTARPTKQAPVACGLCRSPSTALLVLQRNPSLVRAASPSKQQQQQTNNASPRKPSAMPQLPDRRAKGQNDTNSSSSSSSSSKRSHSSSPAPARRSGRRHLPLPPILPPEQQQQAQDRTLAGLLAYSGLLGTVATGVSMVCPDVDLFGGFSLNPADITLGLQLLLPCCLLNLAIMVPDYSSWKVPAEPTLEAQQKMAEALLVWTTNKRAAADAAKASTAAGQGAAAADSAPASSSSDVAAASTSTSGAGATQQQADQDRQPVQPAAASSSSSSSSSVSDPVPAAVTPPWLINNPDPPLPLALARCKDAMLMAQGHYLSSTPRVALSWPLQAGVLLVNCLAAELLYRSVVLQVSGGWLTDRILEAGAEDWFQSAAAQLPVLPTPHMTGQLVAVALLSGAWAVAVARQVLLMSRKPSLVMSSQGKLAAGKLLDDVQRLAASRSKQQPRQQQDKQEGASQQDQQQQGQDGSSSVPSMRAAAGEQQSSSAGGSEPAASSKHTPSSKQAADLAVAAAAEPVSSSGGKRSGRQGFSRQLPNTFTALALQQLVTGFRDLTQSAGLGLAFALTGNLAAPFVAAVVTEGLMAVLQRRGQERSRERSVAFAKHFASFTRVFRDVQRQQQLKQAAEQDQQAGDNQHQAVAQPPATSASTAHDVGAAVPISSSSGGHLGSSAEDDVLDAAVAAAVAAPDAAVLHAAAAAASSDIEAAGGAKVGNTRMERTISVLDQLLGEQLAEQAAAAGPQGK